MDIKYRQLCKQTMTVISHSPHTQSAFFEYSYITTWLATCDWKQHEQHARTNKTHTHTILEFCNLKMVCAVHPSSPARHTLFTRGWAKRRWTCERRDLAGRALFVKRVDDFPLFTFKQLWFYCSSALLTGWEHRGAVMRVVCGVHVLCIEYVWCVFWVGISDWRWICGDGLARDVNEILIARAQCGMSERHLMVLVYIHVMEEFIKMCIYIVYILWYWAKADRNLKKKMNDGWLHGNTCCFVEWVGVVLLAWRI